MNIWIIIKRFKYSQLWELFVLAIKYPLFVYPTLKATSFSFLNAKKEFPKEHGKKGKGNAYRHALWCASICYECYKWNKSRRRIVAWTKLITDKHEELSPNEPLDRRMDLHNNRIGRDLFIGNEFKSEQHIQEVVKYKLESAKQIEEVKHTDKYPLELVYIAEY